MSLAANPTREEVIAAWEANSDYDLVADVTKCREFIRACRLYLGPRNSIKRMSHGLSRGGGGEEVELDLKVQIQDGLKKAESWLAANDTTTLAPSPGGGGVVHPDFSGFRD
jgi:hypothetical protein